MTDSAKLIPESVRALVERFARDIASILYTRHDLFELHIAEDAFCDDAVALANGDEIGCADEEEVVNCIDLPLNYVAAYLRSSLAQQEAMRTGLEAALAHHQIRCDMAERMRIQPPTGESWVAKARAALSPQEPKQAAQEKGGKA